MVVDVLLGFGPNAKFFPVVAEHNDSTRAALGDATEVVDRGLRLLERNRVAERLAAGKDRNHAAIIFGQVVTVELLVGESGVLEVEVVEDRVFNVCGGKIGSERLL